MDKCSTLPIAVYTNETRQDQSTDVLIFQEESQALVSVTKPSSEHLSEQFSDYASSYETDSEDKYSETENDYEIVFTHMPLHTTRSGRHVKAVSRLDL